MSMSPVTLVLASSIEGALVKVLVQLVVVLVAARVFAYLFSRIGQPRVVGEIAAGLALGPSVLGWLFPDTARMLFGVYTGETPAWAGMIGLSPDFFATDVSGEFFLLAQIGLIFLLFLIGLEFDYTHIRRNRAAAGLISVTGIALPFALGYALALWMYPTFADRVGQKTGFCLFMGTAMSITAIPILGRIMMEFNLTRTRLGAITITAAAIDDAVGWTLLASVTAMVQASFSGWGVARMLGLTLAFAALLLFAMRPLLLRWTRLIAPTPDTDLSLNALAGVILLIFVCAIATSLIGIFAIFGAFLLGAALSGNAAFREAFSRKTSHFINAFFLPIFFTYTGLRTDIGSLQSGELWIMAGLVLVVAVTGKFLGCGLAARVSGLSWRESIGVGAMMNTRALMELIVINVGYDLGVIPREIFTMLVIMALVTTVMTSPFLAWLMRSDPQFRTLLESSPFRRSR